MMSLIPLPYRILILAALLLAGVGFGYVQGCSHESNRRDAQQLQQDRAADKARAALQVKADQESARREGIGAARETSREQIRVVYRTIKEKADDAVTKHPEFNDCGLDADSLRNWNAANRASAAAEAVSGEPDYSLSDAASGKVGTPGGLVPEPHRGDGAGSTVPGPDGKAFGVPQSAIEGMK